MYKCRSWWQLNLGGLVLSLLQRYAFWPTSATYFFTFFSHQLLTTVNRSFIFNTAQKTRFFGIWKLHFCYLKSMRADEYGRSPACLDAFCNKELPCQNLMHIFVTSQVTEKPFYKPQKKHLDLKCWSDIISMELGLTGTGSILRKAR